MKKTPVGEEALESILVEAVPQTDAQGQGVSPFAEVSADAGSRGVSAPPREELLRSIQLKVRAELGRRRMSLKEALRLGPGSIVDLEKMAEDPVDLFVGEVLIARGEVIVVEDTFCIRITEVIPQGTEAES
jgi:flagellar motor switch protein FliN/FliY